MDHIYISLPVLLYILGIILLTIFIIIGIRLLRVMDSVDKILKDVDLKVKSLNGVFEIIDVTTDKISLITDRIVDTVSNFIFKIFKKREREGDEDE